MAVKLSALTTESAPDGADIIGIADPTTGVMKKITISALKTYMDTLGSDVTAPTVSSKTVENAAPSSLVVVFSESVTVTTAGWSAKKNGGAWSISSVSGSGTTWTFTMGSAAANGDTLLISYDSTTGATVDGSANELVTFTDSAVTNNVSSSYDADAQTYFTAHETLDSPYTGGQKTAISNFFAGLKTDSLWSAKIQAMYLWRFGTATAHKWNLRNPVDTNGGFRVVFSGTHTHAASGITPDGTTGYGDTFYDINTSGVQDDYSLGYYCPTSDTSNGSDIGADGGATTYHHIEYSTGDMYAIMDSFTAGTFVQNTQATTNGFWVASRTSSTSLKLYKDGTQIGSTATTANDRTISNLSGYTFYVLGKNGPGIGYGKRKQSFAFIGKGMTDTDVSNLNSRLSTLLAAL